MQFSVLKVSQHSLQRTAVEFCMKPLVVEQHFSVQVREALGPDQMERKFAELQDK